VKACPLSPASPSLPLSRARAPPCTALPTVAARLRAVHGPGAHPWPISGVDVLQLGLCPVGFFAYAALSSPFVSSPTPLCLPCWFLRLRRSVFPVGFFAYAALSSPLVSSPTPLISVFPVCFFAYAALSSPLVSSPTPLISVFFQRP
jgi:hypothetical protein